DLACALSYAALNWSTSPSNRAINMTATATPPDAPRSLDDCGMQTVAVIVLPKHARGVRYFKLTGGLRRECVGRTHIVSRTRYACQPYKGMRPVCGNLVIA